MKRLTIALSFLMLAGCGGRVAQPVQLTRAVDPSLTCDHLKAEYDNNLKRRVELTGESADKVGNNIGILLISPLFLDLSDTQKIEVKALLARNGRLEELARGRQCPALAGVQTAAGN